MGTQAASLLRIENATVQRDGVNIIENVSLDIREGEHTAIVGPNGSGKSTLIKLISRQIYPLANAGETPIVTIFGQSVWDVFQLRSLFGIVSPDVHSSFTSAGGISSFEAVLSGFFASQGLTDFSAITDEMSSKALAALSEMGASNLADKPMENLSAGEARRVMIARALVHDPRALLLDEPTAGLDIAARRKFLEALRELAARGRTLILVTHHIEEIVPEIRSVVLMKGGSVYAAGPKPKVLTRENMSKVFGLDLNLRFDARGYVAADLLGESCD